MGAIFGNTCSTAYRVAQNGTVFVERLNFVKY